MNDLERFEVKAEAFRRMTGFMAPGKDQAAASAMASDTERHDAWCQWIREHNVCAMAMLAAFECVMRDKATGADAQFESDKQTLIQSLQPKAVEPADVPY